MDDEQPTSKEEQREETQQAGDVLLVRPGRTPCVQDMVVAGAVRVTKTAPNAGWWAGWKDHGHHQSLQTLRLGNDIRPAAQHRRRRTALCYVLPHVSLHCGGPQSSVRRGEYLVVRPVAWVSSPPLRAFYSCAR